MHTPREVHWSALQYLLAHMYGTLNRGLSLRPVRLWDRRSVAGCRTHLKGAPIMQRSATQRHVTLSVTEAESAARVTEAQDMVYCHNVLTSIGIGAASLNWLKYLLPWNPMKIGDPIGIRFIKMYQKFQIKKLTRRSLYRP
jgi:hypothetical protein